jgi:hypothetical protein
MNFDEEYNLEIDEENEINDSEEPDEEEVWFDALEEGRLHEVDDELKKIRDPKLMTARQVICFFFILFQLNLFKK